MARWAALLVLFAAVAVGANPPAFVPTYSARLGGDDAIQREQLAELRAIRAELQAIRRESPTAPRPAATLKELVSLRCAGCHGERVAEAKGAGFILLEADGKVPALSIAEKRRIMRMTTKGEMPPGAPLTEDERSSLERFLYPPEESP